jgi:hypothetical protein
VHPRWGNSPAAEKRTLTRRFAPPSPRGRGKGG